MTSIKNNNKIKLVIMYISLYLYEVIIGVIWNYNAKKISRKIFFAIMFSAGIIFILFPLKASRDSEFKIIYMVKLLILALPEEILFRWFFQEKFEQIISNKFIATLVVALLFALLHLPNDLSPSTNIISIIFSLGSRTTGHFFFNFIKEKSDSIVVPSIVHAIYNYLIMYL